GAPGARGTAQPGSCAPRVRRPCTPSRALCGRFRHDQPTGPGRRAPAAAAGTGGAGQSGQLGDRGRGAARPRRVRERAGLSPGSGRAPAPPQTFTVRCAPVWNPARPGRPAPGKTMASRTRTHRKTQTQPDRRPDLAATAPAATGSWFIISGMQAVSRRQARCACALLLATVGVAMQAQDQRKPDFTSRVELVTTDVVVR